MIRKSIRLSAPVLPDESYLMLRDVLSSGMLVQGKYVAQLETMMTEYLEASHCILVSNGTAALHLALLSFDIGPGDEVILPAFTFPAVANVVELVGATPVFVDIALNDCCMDVTSIEDKITISTKAILAVHEFGLMADMQVLKELGEKYGLFIIEDAACAIGAAWKGRKAGTMGDMGCFSFHPRKILTTGEGGAIITSNENVAVKLRKMRNHGIDTTSGVVDFVLPGFNYRMTDFQAALGIPQLTKLDETISIHLKQAMTYDTLIGANSEVSVLKPITDSRPTYQTYHLVFARETLRNQVKINLSEAGIESNIGAYSIPQLTYYKQKYGHTKAEFPNAYSAFTQGLALPIGAHLAIEDIELIASIVKKSI